MTMAKRRVEGGFTLIEIMMVLLIIGISVSLVALSITVDDRETALREETERLADTLRFAMDDAVFGGEILGFYLRPQRFSEEFANTSRWQLGWLRRRDNQWFEEADVLGVRTLPEWMAVEMSIDAQPVDLVKQAANATELLPLVVVYPSGDITQFELRLFPTDSSYNEQLGHTLKFNQRGRLVVLKDGEEELQDDD